MGFDDRYKPLLARRVPRDEVTVGRAYVIHARNGGVGIAVVDDGCLGYQLHREKFGSHYLFVEYDWDQGPPHGTAIPLAAIAAKPPGDGNARLAWLSDQEGEHRIEIDAAWEVILGFPPSKLSSKFEK
ncbi:MAG: hypothetical protein H0T46_11530 [Deltaproteobacteria bacterium]|nr:hypothetical protein [Deltaproteobacteria bacterium]